MNESAARAGTAAAAASDHDRFQVHDRREILWFLQTLTQRRSLVTVVCGGGGTSFVSALLEVAPERGEFVVDGAPDDSTHAAVLASSRLTFSTLLDNVRVQFRAHGAGDAVFEGCRALRVALPEVLLRLQRREHYRMRIPPGQALECELRSEAAEVTPLRLRVHDVSCGGIALVDWPDGQAPESHRIYRGGRLLVPDDEPVVVDLEVVYVIDRAEADGNRLKRCGARFVDLPGMHVTRVQRYITRLQRQQKALHAGYDHTVLPRGETERPPASGVAARRAGQRP